MSTLIVNGVVAANFLDKPLRVVATDEDFKFDAEREVGRKCIVNDGVDDHRQDDDGARGAAR